MSKTHPDHKKELIRVRKAKGQLEGVEKMIEERKYCPDIINQIRAARGALKSLEAKILEKHFHHCIRDAFNSKNKDEINNKTDELISLFLKS